jgi:endonuclease YncB( thermonuclease family)
VKTIRSLSQSALVVGGFLFLLLANTVLGQEPVIHGRVVGVTDGDTIKVLVTDQKLLRIRLAFCDAPEKKQAFGARAKRALSDLAIGNSSCELTPLTDTDARSRKWAWTGKM